MLISKTLIAKVAISSPLPQLDHLFDYIVPSELIPQAKVGVRVKVPFGRSKTNVDGFIIEISSESEFRGKLGQIAEVVSEVPVLIPSIYTLARAVADRQASTLGEVLRNAIPDRSVAVEKKWLAENLLAEAELPTLSTHSTNSQRTSSLVRPVVGTAGPTWAQDIVNRSKACTEAGQSTVIVVPDFRDQKVLATAFESSGMADIVVDFSSTQVKSKRYQSFLRCLSSKVLVVIGSRAAVYAPVQNLGQIIIWDDGDVGHQEPASPFSHSREVALLRQRVQPCDVHFLGHSRSTEVQRLVAIGFVQDQTSPFPIPKIANSDSDLRVDSMAWKAIREASKSGPVLVQVAGRGNSISAYCANCDTRSQCKLCSGPLWMDSRSQLRCRWCNAANLDHRCVNCQGTKVRTGRAGSARTLSEFGKAFPGVKLIESTGDNPLLKIDQEKCIVVSTPGAEPTVENGYRAVIILDAPRLLARDSLRATEDAVRFWSNAVALMSTEGQAVLVGLGGILAQKFSLWAQQEIAQHELDTRVELRFPPAVRLASVGAEPDLLEKIIPELKLLSTVEVLGPITIYDRGQQIESKVILKYDYSEGPELAATLKAQALRLSAGQKRVSARSGRSMRPIRVKMDDNEVL